MKALTAVLLASLVACAHPDPRRVNVASIRHAIDDTIQTQSDKRTIVSMGKVSNERAVIYTKSTDNARHEETWVHEPRGWRLEASAALEASTR